MKSKGGDWERSARAAFHVTASEIDNAHFSKGGVWTARYSGVVKVRAKYIFPMAPAAFSIVHDQRDNDSTRVPLPIKDVFTGASTPLAKAGHAIPRHCAAGSCMPAGAPRSYIENMGERAAGDALRKNQRRERTRFLKEPNRLIYGAISPQTLGRSGASGQDSRVLLGSGPSEIEFVADLEGQL